MAWIWAVILSALIFIYLLHKFIRKRENLPPGPTGLPVLGHLHLLGENPHRDLYDLARKHGPIMHLRLGFVPAVVLSSPAAAELVLKTHDAVFASRPNLDATKYMWYNNRSIIFGPYGSYWREMRKLFALELLSGPKIKHFQAMREHELGLLVESLKQGAERRVLTDVSKKTFGIISDMTFRMVFGRKFRDSDLDEKGFKSVIAETLEMAARFNLADYFPFIGPLDLQGMNRRMKSLSEKYDRCLERVIDDHIKSKQGKRPSKDFVDVLMSKMESGEGMFELGRCHVKAMLLDLIIAGIDGPATAVDWTVAELIRHPQVMKKLQNELEQVVGLDHMVDESHLDKLEYLDFVVKESLRLHPPAPLLIPRESMEDCVLDNYYVQKKSRIIVNAWAIGRDPSVWPNPHEFCPERFVGVDIEAKGFDFQLLPFGSGRRTCPGIQLGHRLLEYVVAQLVHCFDWELPNGMEPIDLDMSEHFGIGTCRATHILAVPAYRLKM